MQKKLLILFKNKLNLAIMLALIILTFLTTLFITQNMPFISVEDKTELDVKVMEERIRSIAELSTLTYGYSDAGIFSEQKSLSVFGNDIGILGTKKSFIFIYDGEMKFGIDLSQISINNNDNNNVINVTLPPIQLFSHTIKEDSIMILDEKSGLFNSFSMTDYTDFMVAQKEEMEEQILERNLFEQAKDNAELQLRAFILSMPGITEEHEVRFVD